MERAVTGAGAPARTAKTIQSARKLPVIQAPIITVIGKAMGAMRRRAISKNVKFIFLFFHIRVIRFPKILPVKSPEQKA
jgi:hypothetical protein